MDKLNAINKKIIISCHSSVGNKKITQIYGLELFNEIKCDEFIKDIKKSLGTNFIKRTDDKDPTKIYYGFNGNHIDSIYDILTNKYKIDKSYISK